MEAQRAIQSNGLADEDETGTRDFSSAIIVGTKIDWS